MKKMKKKYKVVLLNDSQNSFEHVIDTLVELTGCKPSEAMRIADKVHYKGSETVFVGKKKKCKKLLNELSEAGLTVKTSKYTKEPKKDMREVAEEAVIDLLSQFTDILDESMTRYNESQKGMKVTVKKTEDGPKVGVTVSFDSALKEGKDYLSGKKNGEEFYNSIELGTAATWEDPDEKVWITISDNIKAINDSFIKGFFMEPMKILKTKEAMLNKFVIEEKWVELFSKNFKIFEVILEQ